MNKKCEHGDGYGYGIAGWKECDSNEEMTFAEAALIMKEGDRFRVVDIEEYEHDIILKGEFFWWGGTKQYMSKELAKTKGHIIHAEHKPMTAEEWVRLSATNKCYDCADNDYVIDSFNAGRLSRDQEIMKHVEKVIDETGSMGGYKKYALEGLKNILLLESDES
jgi:hypothetical protein